MQFPQTIDFHAGGQFGGRLDRLARASPPQLGAHPFTLPIPDGVVFLEGQAPRIDAAMAAGASFRFAVRCEQLGDGRRTVFRIFAFQFRHIGRWRWRRFIEQVFQQPHPAFDRMPFHAIRGPRQDSRVGQHAAAMMFRRERDSAELGAANVRDPVVRRERFVEERVPRFDQLEQAAVFPQEGADKVQGLLPHRGRQFVVEAWITVALDRDALQSVQLEPLLGELLDERPRTRIGQHPSRLFGERRWRAKLARPSQCHERFVGHGAPEEVR